MRDKERLLFLLIDCMLLIVGFLMFIIGFAMEDKYLSELGEIVLGITATILFALGTNKMLSGGDPLDE